MGWSFTMNAMGSVDERAEDFRLFPSKHIQEGREIMPYGIAVIRLVNGRPRWHRTSGWRRRTRSNTKGVILTIKSRPLFVHRGTEGNSQLEGSPSANDQIRDGN